jgi:hypothetical protein
LVLALDDQKNIMAIENQAMVQSLMGVHIAVQGRRTTDGSLFVEATRALTGKTPSQVAAVLQELSPAGLRVVSQPPGSQVYVDDKLMGVTSTDRGELRLESLQPGSAAVRVTAPGYRDSTQSVTLTAGNTSNLEARLAKELSRLSVETRPGNVQVYLDDAFKGLTSDREGRLRIEDLAPGAHRVRMNVIGYKEAAQTVELKAGETATVEAKLEPAGPKPLELGEIEEALANGVPPKGITKLVNQYGVDFALTKEIEQRLREKGADSGLLLAIATGKK